MDNNFHFIVPVWREKYTKLFINICLPLLLTKNNLYARRYSKQDYFVIVTTTSDSNIIKKSAIYLQLQQLLPVKFILLDSLLEFKNVYQAMSLCYATAMGDKSVIPEKTYFIFLTADSFTSDGAFKELYDLANKKYLVAMIMGLRVHSEQILNIINEFKKKNKSIIDLPKDEFISIIIENLHPISKNLNVLSNNFNNCWPSHLYWIDEKNNFLIAHCFHLHPIMVRAPKTPAPTGITIDGEFVQNLGYSKEQYYIFQKDHFCVSLTDDQHQCESLTNDFSIKKIIQFSLLHANNLHIFFLKHQIILGPTKEIMSMSQQAKMITENIFNLREKLRYKFYYLYLNKIFRKCRYFIKYITSKI